MYDFEDSNTTEAVLDTSSNIYPCDCYNLKSDRAVLIGITIGVSVEILILYVYWKFKEDALANDPNPPV